MKKQSRKIKLLGTDSEQEFEIGNSVTVITRKPTKKNSPIEGIIIGFKNKKAIIKFEAKGKSFIRPYPVEDLYPAIGLNEK